LNVAGESAAVRLFVYGTLKRGQWGHARYCAGLRGVERATVAGRLYLFEEEYPGLEIPEASVLATATGDPAADVLRQAQVVEAWTSAAANATSSATSSAPVERQLPDGDWQWIEGELLTLADARAALPAIERYEACDPVEPGRGEYRRVLAAVWPESGGPVPAWVYVCDAERLSLKRWTATVWPANGG
jgi:gamma-glutamylcyclotransferase (GGCT)/AIG2-like uncharacterized protein YtfP